ncbi:hypothetical protein [uncultured Sphingomonas sp.]|uniref:hypothetical protein n=1 Tax=uncultured Sphingomonas sp. TaxID=158754 RepID=UPI0035CB8A74
MAAMAARTCPPYAIGPGFAAARVMPALPHFHMAMMLLNREARETLHFALGGCSPIAEDEAVLLEIVGKVRIISSSRTLATLGMIMQEDAVAPLAAALAGVAECFTQAGLGLGLASRPRRAGKRSTNE